MPIEPHTTSALIVALLLAVQVAGIGAWGLFIKRHRRQGFRQ